jgi:uncharacterized HAD superfamily protein
MDRNNSLKVVLDIDGVLADFEGKYCYNFGYENRRLVSLEQRHPYWRKEVKWFVDNPKTYIDLKPISLGVQVYNELLARDFKIWFVTSRPKEAVGITQFWLDAEDFRLGTLLMNGGDKMEIIASLKPLFIVDDIADVALKAKKLGIPALLIAQPWNEASSVPRFSNIDEFDRELEVILAMRHNENRCTSQ